MRNSLGESAVDQPSPDGMSSPTHSMIVRLRHFHIRDIAVCGAFIAIFALALKPVLDNDVFWHLATGRFIWATGMIPHTDPFSWTAYGHAWIAHEWLTEVFLYALYTHGGFTVLEIGFALVITCIFYLSYATARTLGASRPWATGVTILAAFASLHTWGVRPQMLSLLLLALCALLLRRVLLYGQHRLLWLLPPLMALWVNLHGGFIFGLVMIGLWSVSTTAESWWQMYRGWGNTSEEKRPALTLIWCVCVLSFAATLLNPNSVKGVLYPFSYLGNNASTRYVAEWVRPDFHQFQYQLFGSLLVLLILGLVFSPRRPRPLEALLTILFAYLGLQSVRNINLFCVVVAPFIAVYLTCAWRQQMEKRGRASLSRARPEVTAAKAVLNLVLVFLIIGAVLVDLGPQLSNGYNIKKQAGPYPTAAIIYLQKHHLTDRLFNSYNWGGYLIWRLYPTVKVYVDGRPDMYGDRFMDLFVKTWKGEKGWSQRLRDVHFVLVESTSGIGKALAHSREWRLIYHDKVAVLYERSSG